MVHTGLSTEIFQEPRYQNLIESMQPGKYFWVLVVPLVLGVVIGGLAWIVQLIEGLGVTGLNYRLFWGFYLVNFVFFIGISHAGTLISAILRVTGAGWRAPITRMAEAITTFSLIVGGSMILIDMGRFDRLWHIPVFPNFTSPLVWDFTSVTTYLVGSMMFLYLPMIPDMGMLREYYKEKIGTGKANLVDKARFQLYRLMALNWQGTKLQIERLERGIKIMAILIIPIAVSVHTVVSFVFSMHWRPGWHSTIFGPYFVVGAIFSGIAGLLVAMAIFRKMYKLEDFITPKQFNNLALLLLAFAALYLYFTVAEFLTAAYTGWKEEAEILEQLFYGQFAWGFWTFLVLGLIIPMFLLAIPKTRHSVLWVTIASLLVNYGMYVKRFIIVVPTVSAPVYSENWLVYSPTWVEIAITVAGFSGFILLYVVFSKIFPIIAIWEFSEWEHEEKEALAVVDTNNKKVAVSGD